MTAWAMTTWLSRLLVPILLAAAASAPARAERVAHVRLDRSVVTYEVAADASYVETSEIDRTLLTPRGIQSRDRFSVTYYPDTQTLDVLEAWVDQPDGSRLPVGPENRFTRPSAAGQGAPGFTGSLTTTVVYPQLRPGSRIHVKFRRVQRTPPLLGFNAWSEQELENPTVEDRLVIEAPATLALHWGERGGVAVTDTTTDGRRRIVAEMPPGPGQDAERSAVDTSDYQKLFVATTLPNLEAIGAIYHRQSEGRAAVTPEIAALAAGIVGGRTGLEAAHAIYDWVTVNIRYIAVYLNPDDGWVPHAASEVVKNGFGDCKDHVVLMQALLAARGIDGEAAIIQWGNRFVDAPVWQPFQFNHVIVYLPDYDIYLNPTNPYATFDSLDRTLSGKTVVIATAQGRVARTPASTPDSYKYAIDSRIAIGADGTIEGAATYSLSPNMDASFRATLASASSPRDLMERLLLGTPEGGFGGFSATDPRDLATPLAVSGTWRSPRGVTFRDADTAITLPTGPDVEPVYRLRRFLSADGTRRTPMLVGATALSWTATITLPPGVSARLLPSDVDWRTAAGHYTAHYRRDGARVLVSRRLVIDRDVFQPDEVPALEDLVYAALDDARATLTLSRAEADADLGAGRSGGELAAGK
jgi:transglutaminase-like putative cysteine protease